MNDFRKKLKDKERLIGTLVTIASPEIVEIMVEVGFDWLFIDMEHGAFDTQGALPLLQAAGDRCPCVLRVPAGEEVWIKKALDIGASGIIVPQVNTPEQARAVVSMCRYPPAGVRGVGIGRAHGYGHRFKEYLESANESIAVIVQAEHAQAVAQIDAIAGVAGIDAILIGPYDLSASLGMMGRVDSPEVAAAIQKIKHAGETANVALGIFGVNAKAVAGYLGQGFSLIAVGVDSLFLVRAADADLTALRAPGGA